MKKQKQTQRTFEQAVRRLEEVVEALEAGDTDLDKALALYEEGLQLSHECAERLKAAELRVRKLMKDSPAPTPEPE